jgi:hypothetical protein
MLRLPLGSDANLNASMLMGQRSQSIAAKTPLNVYLPVLNGIPLRDIIRLRRDEHDNLSNFN